MVRSMTLILNLFFALHLHAASHLTAQMKAIAAIGASPNVWRNITNLKSIEWMRSEAEDRVQVYHLRSRALDRSIQTFEIKVRWLPRDLDDYTTEPHVISVAEVPARFSGWRRFVRACQGLLGKN